MCGIDAWGAQWCGCILMLCTSIWRWHFCFIKQHLVQSFGLRLYYLKWELQVPPLIGPTRTKKIHIYQFQYTTWSGFVYDSLNKYNIFTSCHVVKICCPFSSSKVVSLDVHITFRGTKDSIQHFELSSIKS